MSHDTSGLGIASPVPPSGGRVVGLLLGLFIVLVLLAAVTAVALVRYGLPHLPPAWAETLTHRGTGKIMSRAMQVWLLILLPLVLRFSGWRGWRDCGWQRAAGTGRALGQDLLAGLALGVATLGSLALFMFLTGRRVTCAIDPATSVLFVVVGYALSATVVAVFEETVARGILFRLWARAWGVVVAALISSVLFALAHFLSPDDAAFQRPGFWPAVGALSLSVLRPETGDPAFYIRLLNLTILGLALCAMVRLTGSIWLAVGAHAGWVWSIKLNNFLTDALPLPLRSRIWGARGDLTDSVIGSATLLAVLLAVLWLLWRRARRGGPG